MPPRPPGRLGPVTFPTTQHPFESSFATRPFRQKVRARFGTWPAVRRAVAPLSRWNLPHADREPAMASAPTGCTHGRLARCTAATAPGLQCNGTDGGTRPRLDGVADFLQVLAV